MKTAMIALISMAMCAAALGDFSTGGSDLMEFRGYNNFRYSMWGRESHDPSSGYDLYNQIVWAPRISEIFSAKMQFETRYGFTAYDTVTARYVSDDYTFKLSDSYLKLHFSPEITLTGGRFKLPFGLGYNIPGSSLLFYDRPMMAACSDFLAYGGRDVGAMLSTDFGPAIVTLAYTNGTDTKADTTMNKQFTADVFASPTRWLNLGAAVAIIGQPELQAQDSWSTTGLDFYLHGGYPFSEKFSLHYLGEYMILPWQGPVVENMNNENGGDYNFQLSGRFSVDMGILTAIQPAFRYELLSPPEQVATGSGIPETDQSALDICLNLHTGDMNTVQIGSRSFSYEDGQDGYTDVYLNWRMLF